MSWLLAFLGFAALIILHEAGHFAAAKAVGMRVERFSLFFPPLIARLKRGETEYAIGALPLGGYVKITGMNPAEEIPPEAADRAYFRQPVWKRVVVIAAGPAVNIVIAFAIFAGVFWANGTVEPPPKVGTLESGSPAATALKPGDTIVAVDGRKPVGATLDAQNNWVVHEIAAHRCAGAQTEGCRAAEPVSLTVRRDGALRTVQVRPFYDAKAGIKRMRIGFSPDGTTRPAGPVRSAGLAVSQMWHVTTGTVKAIAGIFDTQQRKQISGVAGSYKVTQQAFAFSLTTALIVLGVISLSLGVINLFPFLPLDGGHIFWAVAEKVRGRAIPFSVMERAGFVGFALVVMLFLIGLTNDIGRFTGDGFRLR
jgi:regulator of sigma E protease